MMKQRSPPLTMTHMNRMKSKASLSTSAGTRCNVCVPILYEKEWAYIKLFTQLQCAVKLFVRNSSKTNDPLNTTINARKAQRYSAAGHP